MAYDDGLAVAIRARLGARPGVSEREMFGGIAFLVNGNMAVGVTGDDLMVRVGKDAHDDAVRLPGAHIFDMGRPMRGWLLVSPDGFATDDDLGAWIDRGLGHAETLPAQVTQMGDFADATEPARRQPWRDPNRGEW